MDAYSQGMSKLQAGLVAFPLAVAAEVVVVVVEVVAADDDA
jgi:hypothetical protein